MKKIILFFLAVFAMALVAPIQLNAAPDEETTTLSTTSVKSNAMTDRLNEINSIDKSTLSSTEKKELRKEERTIKSEMKAEANSSAEAISNGGVYVSVGAAILIVILLVLLLK